MKRSGLLILYLILSVTCFEKYNLDDYFSVALLREVSVERWWCKDVSLSEGFIGEEESTEKYSFISAQSYSFYKN